MSEISNIQKAQLDKAERERLQDVVEDLRERVENNVGFQLTQKGLDDEPGDLDDPDEEIHQLVEAIDIEGVDGHTWDEAFEKYVTGVGYTIVNRLAALRCMEVRGFIDEEVTVFKENGLTPAAETLVHEEFLLEDEAILEAYHRVCDTLAEEIEILFDRSSAYSLVDPDDDTFEELCGMLDEVPDEVWRADDVLGWVYEYYNVKLLDDLRRKGDRVGLDPEDVPPANQFYTPHWVVRMLTDNSLGKLYLEHTGDLQDVVDRQDNFSLEERKHRPLSPKESPGVADFCTYLVPSEEEGDPLDFDHPEELRVIDPACGSGHFLVYAFDILERIWRTETDVERPDIPRKILQHNLYGVDLDMRSCQLAAFNLYLKARSRAEAEGGVDFDMPMIGIVCADASVADVKDVEGVFAKIADGDKQVEKALRRILDAFEESHGLGSLLDVRGTLGELFQDDTDVPGKQISLGDDPGDNSTLGQVLHSLRKVVDEHRDPDSFLAKDLRSFLKLLDILSQDYDVALMNPPYGTQNRMPDSVDKYVREKFEYKPEFYINFFEVCEKLVQGKGRVAMIVPRTFMFKRSFRDFREDFIGEEGSFSFLAEFGIGILDNATVRTTGTVVRIGEKQTKTADFYRLHDVDSGKKEQAFVRAAFENTTNKNVRRHYRRDISEFSIVPGSPLSYWVPLHLRSLYKMDMCFDADNANTTKKSLGVVKTGLQTGNNDRFLRRFWEVNSHEWIPFAKGGTDAWILPTIDRMVFWDDNAEELRRISGSRVQNVQYYFTEGLTYTNVKEGGKRFGYLHENSIFGISGQAFLPKHAVWQALAYANSNLTTYLMLTLTTGRHWQAGEVSRLPWDDQLASSQKLEELSKEILSDLLHRRQHQIESPYYQSPLLLSLIGYQNPLFHENHPHIGLFEYQSSIGFVGSYKKDDRIPDVASGASKYYEAIATRLNKKEKEIDDLIFKHFGINENTKTRIHTEINLRTNEDPTKQFESDPIPVSAEYIGELVRELVHHFSIEVIQDSDDGIIPLIGNEESTMHEQIIQRFHDIYDDHATDRLVEVDNILGSESATEEAYPNIRAFIENELFDYHVDQMENTPILWRLTTERLIADSVGEGFTCFVDYHSLNSGLFDRIANHYLEPRKAELRERRSAANRRRNDTSLATSEQAEAAEQYERCRNGLDQIAVFEEVIQELGSTDERDFDEKDRQRVEGLAPKVSEFRKETRHRIETLVTLHERNDEGWFEETFSDKFWNAVDESRGEWLAALEELESACKAYAKPTYEPVDAHLADLFDYFNSRLKGSDHYSSSGILFMTYYFEREGADLLDDDGQPFDTLTEDERLLASLATGLNDPSILDEEFLEVIADDEGVEKVDHLPPLAEFKALAEEINDRCQTIDKRIPSDWTNRALSEITTAGYQPNQKHGVKINITPLANAEIVPKTVDEKVL